MALVIPARLARYPQNGNRFSEQSARPDKGREHPLDAEGTARLTMRVLNLTGADTAAMD